MSNGLSGISRTIAAIVLVIIIIVAGVLVYAYYASTQPKPTLTVYALWTGTEQYNFEQVLGNFTQNAVSNEHNLSSERFIGYNMGCSV
jgi:ABC-type glycerol-3-phosphate transport system substrate-binding protein